MRKVLYAFAVVLLIVGQVVAQSPAPSKADVESRIDAILAKMTLEQKIDYIGGIRGFYVREMPQLGLPAFKMADGPIGVRNYGPSTTYAAGIALAASWDPEIAKRVGTMIGHDARTRGVHYMLGPGANIYRAPMNGRNFEYLGEDPFLAGRMAVGYVTGMQSTGVSATIKHYMGNNSEFLRHDSDSVIDERTMREIYLPAFEAAVREAHVGSIMNSYNLINGEHATQSSFINNQVAKKEWGFDGVMMSDWVATYDAVGAANGGLDLEMPSALFMNKENLLPAIKEGKVSVATIDDKVRRILRLGIRLGWLDHDQTDLTWSRYSPESKQAALDAALASMVLLKNDGNLLPLDKGKIKTIAVIGPNAFPGIPVGGGSAQVRPFTTVSFLEGLGRYVGTSVNVTYSRGIQTLEDMARNTHFNVAPGGKRGVKMEFFTNGELSGTPASTKTVFAINTNNAWDDTDFEAIFAESGLDYSALAKQGGLSNRWTGYYTAAKAGTYEIFFQHSGENSRYRLLVDDKTVSDQWNSVPALTDVSKLQLTAGPHKVVVEQRSKNRFGGLRVRVGIADPEQQVSDEAKAIAKNADVVVLAVGYEPDTESEGADRTFQLPPAQDQLIKEISAANKNTIVVVTSGGGVDMAQWIDKVPGLIQAWYPGEEGGNALPKILFGDVNPSGHLPVTFERRWEDNPVHDSYYSDKGQRVVYKEGVFVGYRGYEKNGTKPLFPFGYGLTYTTFKYANLVVTPIAAGQAKYQVTFDVTNTGTRAGAAVAQVYVADGHASVPRPSKELKGFSKVTLQPGETKKVTVPLDARSFAYYDVKDHAWIATAGKYGVIVGSASDKPELTGDVTLEKTVSTN
jgi:beta-glucosidase